MRSATTLTLSTSTAAPTPSPSSTSHLQILMMPDYRNENPYQTLLSDALTSLGVNVQFPTGYRRVLPLSRAISASHPRAHILHLHWLSPYLKGTILLTYVAYAMKFCVDLCMVRLAGVELVWTIHNSVSHEARFPRVERCVRRVLARLARGIIVHSQAALAELQTDLGLDAGKTSVVHHGHYRNAYRSAINQVEARRQLGVPEAGMLYLYFGMVRPYKGIDALLSAWDRGAASREPSTLVIAGIPTHDRYAAVLKEYGRSRINVFMHLCRISDDAIHLYFSAADVVVLPFQKVLTSGSLLLAMSYSKPVIAPRFDTLSEALGDSGELLYDPADKDGLFRALEVSARSDLRAVAAKTEHQCDTLGWDRIATDTAAVYNFANKAG